MPLKGKYTHTRSELSGGDRRRTMSYSKEPVSIEEVRIAMRKAKKQFGPDTKITLHFNS